MVELVEEKYKFSQHIEIWMLYLVEFRDSGYLCGHTKD